MKSLRAYLVPVALSLLLFAHAFRFAPGPQIEGPPHFDKLLHFLFFGFLATTIIRIPRVRSRSFGPWLAWLAATLIGVLDEIFQGFSPFRTADPLDVLADSLGAALAIFLYLKWPHYRRILESRLAGRD